MTIAEYLNNFCKTQREDINNEFKCAGTLRVDRHDQ